MSSRAKGAKGLGKSQSHVEYSDNMSKSELDEYLRQEMWAVQFRPDLKGSGWEKKQEASTKLYEKIMNRWNKAQAMGGEKKTRKPRQKRDLSPDSRAEERSRREKKLGRAIAPSPAAAAWNGLVTSGADKAYSAIMKDAAQKGYNVTKTEAARTAKKHKDPSEAVVRARAHHKLAPPTPQKKQKK